MARRKRKRKGPSFRDLAEVRSGTASAEDRAEARSSGLRKLKRKPSKHRGKRAR